MFYPTLQMPWKPINPEETKFALKKKKKRKEERNESLLT